MQVTTDIPEDHEVVYFSKEKLEQDYRRFVKRLILQSKLINKNYSVKTFPTYNAC